MKKLYILIFIPLIAVILMGQSKIGYINSRRIFNEYKGMEDINKKISKEMNQWKEEITQMENEIIKLEREYANEAPMLSEEAKIRKRDAINKKRDKLNAFIETIWGENGKATTINSQMLTPVIEKLNEVLKEIAETESYAAIFDISEGNVIYITPENNLTERVIEELNKEFFVPVQKVRDYIVYDFLAEDKETRNEQYHIKLATSLYKNLQVENKIEAISIREVNALLQNRGVTDIEDMTIQDRINYATELEADYAVSGSVSMSGSRIIMKVEVLDIRRRTLLKDIEKEADGDMDFDSKVSEIITEIKKLMEEGK
ncbi:MAG: OmpH family outer membrane protein [candidate division WOR-3 bacterium]|nr:OmpH family outer membrane protein [candidate division WOR-3 bacterium]